MNIIKETIHSAGKRLFSLLLCAALCFFSACGEAPVRPAIYVASAPSPLPEKTGLRVAVASDIHLNPDGGSGEDAASLYSMELVDALLWDAKTQEADLLLLTGDLVSDGKAYRHEALIEKLRRAEENGLCVCVLPGNHDLAPVGQTEFSEMYREFGYGEAFSRDPSSLSYGMIQDDLMLLMMDCGGYSAGCVDLEGAERRTDNVALLSDETLAWAEEMLRNAQDRGLRVLCAGHYNLLTPTALDPERSGYYVRNGERFAALLRSCGVPLYLSGHIHLRAVYQEAGLTELVTEYLLGYPTGYSVLDLSEGEIRYTPRRIDVEAWAESAGAEDPKLRHFSAWQEEALWRYAQENVAYMARRNPLTKRETDNAALFYYEAITAFWQGTMPQQREALRKHPGYRSFFKCAKGYAYEWWLRDLMDNASPLLSGFTLNWQTQTSPGRCRKQFPGDVFISLSGGLRVRRSSGRRRRCSCS